MRRTSALCLAAAALALTLAGCGEGGRTDTGGTYHNGDGYTGTYGSDASGTTPYGGTYNNADGSNYSGTYNNGANSGYNTNGGTYDSYRDGDSLMDDAGNALRNGANDVRNAVDDAGDAIRNGVNDARTGLTNGNAGNR